MKKFTGKDLIDLGYKPGQWFGAALEIINQQKLSVDEIHRLASKMVPPPPLDLHAKPAPFHLNITAETEDEQANVEAVRRTFETLMLTPTLVEGAVMPDACPAGSEGTIPVGGVVAARNAIHPGMHSADICCSVQATIFENTTPADVLDAIHAVTHFGPGGRNDGDMFSLPKEMQEAFRENRFLKHQQIAHFANTHLGTQGDGNHFAFVGISEGTGKTVLVTHHGSRGVGARLYREGMRVAEQYRQKLSPATLKTNAWIPADTADGRDYWDALQLLRGWTKLNHDVLHDAALARLGGDVRDRFWNEHNFVFREEDEKGALFWHAKGATPIHADLLPDTNGTQIVPLNMAEPILFIQGERTANNRGFAPHGAGRNLSRTRHKGRVGDRSPNEVFAEETDGLDVRFFTKHIDVSELPSAYKNADAVQADMARFNLAEITDRILPYGSIMAGDWEVEAPWRRTRKENVGSDQR